MKRGWRSCWKRQLHGKFMKDKKEVAGERK